MRWVKSFCLPVKNDQITPSLRYLTTAMTCKLSGLFSIGEDFDEDLLGTDWTTSPISEPASVAAAAPSCALRASSAAHNGQNVVSFLPNGERSTALHSSEGSENTTTTTQSAVGQTVAWGLRQLSTSTQQRSIPPPPSSPLHPPVQENAHPNLAPHQQIDTGGQQKATVPQDDFDDWDLDLADLDESDPQMGIGIHVPQTFQAPVRAPAPAPVVAKIETESAAKRLRPSTCVGAQTVSSSGLRGISTPNQTSSLSSSNIPLRYSSTVPLPSSGPRPAFPPAPPQSPGVFPGLTSASPFSSPLPRPRGPPPHQPQRPWATLGPSPQGRSLFEPISPAPTPMSSPGLTPRHLHTPFLTNHLVQLMSASNKTPNKRSRSDPNRPKTRRFPGPAGVLPQQPHGQSLDDIVVSVPQTPAHGAVARLPSQAPSSQSEEDEFSGGPWAVMKAEMGLDERNPSCFLHSYSVVMVLRKAALKQLAKNKVPNMAVILKSILHTHTDAKAVFRDPTGEIQGTVHRRLLEDRLGELKAGAVLLLKQVGVFSPSHRNHYLNVTPNNLLRIYPPDGVCLSSNQLSPPVLEPVLPSPTRSPRVPEGPMSQMQLVFEDDEEEEKIREAGHVPADFRACSTGAPKAAAGNRASPPDLTWDADDDLDELLGELPEEAYSL